MGSESGNRKEQQRQQEEWWRRLDVRRHATHAAPRLLASVRGSPAINERNECADFDSESLSVAHSLI